VEVNLPVSDDVKAVLLQAEEEKGAGPIFSSMAS